MSRYEIAITVFLIAIALNLFRLFPDVTRIVAGISAAVAAAFLVFGTQRGTRTL